MNHMDKPVQGTVNLSDHATIHGAAVGANQGIILGSYNDSTLTIDTLQIITCTPPPDPDPAQLRHSQEQAYRSEIAAPATPSGSNAMPPCPSRPRQ
jgi:hypothetical protein